jgi:hypothetical protein
MQNQQQELHLKPGDTAYYINTFGHGEIYKVIIIDKCVDEEGKGYEASCPAISKNFSNPDDSMHTCNGFLAISRKLAKQKSLEILKKKRITEAKIQAESTRNIQWYDYWIANGGCKIITS